MFAVPVGKGCRHAVAMADGRAVQPELPGIIHSKRSRCGCSLVDEDQSLFRIGNLVQPFDVSAGHSVNLGVTDGIHGKHDGVGQHLVAPCGGAPVDPVVFQVRPESSIPYGTRGPFRARRPPVDPRRFVHMVAPGSDVIAKPSGAVDDLVVIVARVEQPGVRQLSGIGQAYDLLGVCPSPLIEGSKITHQEEQTRQDDGEVLLVERSLWSHRFLRAIRAGGAPMRYSSSRALRLVRRVQWSYHNKHAGAGEVPVAGEGGVSRENQPVWINRDARSAS